MAYYISILDFSTENNLILEDEDEITKGMQTEDIESLLGEFGFHASQCSFMVTDEDPETQRTTMRELADEDYDNIIKKYGRLDRQ